MGNKMCYLFVWKPAYPMSKLQLAIQFYKQTDVNHTMVIYMINLIHFWMHIINHICKQIYPINYTKQTKFSIISIGDVNFFFIIFKQIYDLRTAVFTIPCTRASIHTYTHAHNQTNASLWRSRAHMYQHTVWLGKFHSHHMAAYGYG